MFIILLLDFFRNSFSARSRMDSTGSPRALVPMPRLDSAVNALSATSRQPALSQVEGSRDTSFFKIGLFFILAPSSLASVPDQEKFLQAVQSYNNADVKQAKELLSSLNNKNLSVNYNLGNCNFHLGEYTQAILNWRRAQKGASYRDYIELEKFISKASDKLKLDSKHALSFKDYFLALIASWSTIFIQLILFLVWFLFLAAILFDFRFKKVALLLLLFLVCVFGCAYFCKLHNTRLIVLEPTKLVAGPSNDFFVIKNLQAGEQLELLEKKEIWYKVKTHEHKGWLHSQAVELV